MIHRLTPGEELIITENNQPVARLTTAGIQPHKAARRPGTLRGSVLYLEPDFDAPLEDFKEYMQ